MAWVLSAYGYLLDGNPINPLQLNDWMNDPNNPDPYYRSLVNWSAIYDLSGGNLIVHETSNQHFGNDTYASDPSILNGYLQSGDIVFVQVYNSKAKKDHHHWVVVKSELGGEYPIMDPGYSSTSDLSDYGSRFWEYVVITKQNGK